MFPYFRKSWAMSSADIDFQNILFFKDENWDRDQGDQDFIATLITKMTISAVLQKF